VFREWPHARGKHAGTGQDENKVNQKRFVQLLSDHHSQATSLSDSPRVSNPLRGVSIEVRSVIATIHRPRRYVSLNLPEQSIVDLFGQN
jgi:uncharacterized protein (DUF305 family)